MELLIFFPEFGTVPAFYIGELGASIYIILCIRNLELPLTSHLPLSLSFIHYQVMSFPPLKSTLKISTANASASAISAKATTIVSHLDCFE